MSATSKATIATDILRWVFSSISWEISMKGPVATSSVFGKVVCDLFAFTCFLVAVVTVLAFSWHFVRKFWKQMEDEKKRKEDETETNRKRLENRKRLRKSAWRTKERNAADKEMEIKRMELESKIKMRRMEKEMEEEIEKQRMEYEKDRKADEKEMKKTQMENEKEMEMKRMELKKDIEMKRMDDEKEIAKRAIENEQREAATKRRKTEYEIYVHRRAIMRDEGPKADMLKYAKEVIGRSGDTAVLQKLEAKGFKSFAVAQYFKAKSSEVEVVAKGALHDVPPDMQQDIAKQLHLCIELRAALKFFTFNDGQGALAEVLVKSEEFEGEKIIALLAYGISFECKKVVEYYEKIFTPVPIYEDVPTSVLVSNGVFNDTYSPQMHRKFVRTDQVEKQIPVFKQEVLSLSELTLVNEALEFEASKKALVGMS